MLANNRRRDSINHPKPFVGCDGEGCGVDHLGRQHFMLLRIGENELFTGKPLTTCQCLDFICDSDNYIILVGFSFGYDITMILRDLPSERRERLLAKKDRNLNPSPYTYYKNFAIDYLPRNYIRVARTEQRVDSEGKIYTGIVKNSSRTIYETFGFFQKSFLASLKSFNIGEEYLELIERNKSARADFNSITDEIREYCRIECMLLAELMENMRKNCHEAGIVPRTWSGAGKLAESLHKKFDTINRDKIEKTFDSKLLDLASEAYYGGRFEITRTGKVAGPIFEYDIRSAYPAAMVRLPCLKHGEFRSFAKNPSDADGFYLASIGFKYTGEVKAGTLGGFPVRHKKGHIFWPMEGNGVYWSCEIQSAIAMGFSVSFRHGFEYVKKCDCKSNDWVNELYEYRRSIGSTGPGYPIKLGINSLYGKLAQRLGRAFYHNIIWAGLITAITRSTINNIISKNQCRIVMIATDGIYSLDEIELPVGENLGEFERTELNEGLFIVQPGLYFGAKKRKTRGLPFKLFEQPGKAETFFDAWKTYAEKDKAAYHGEGIISVPTVDISVTRFIGLKLAQARGKPDTAGCWVEETRHISFDWQNKRSRHLWDGECTVTYPILGNRRLVSYGHADFIKSDRPSELDALREELDDQPDYVDLSIPWKD
jgi:hypothetical protein